MSTQVSEKILRIALVGKYVGNKDSYESINEALIHGAIANQVRLELEYINSEDIEASGAEARLKGFDAILVPYGETNELHLASIHPGHTVEEIRENTGWDLKTIPDLAETPAPSKEEMDALHQIDTDGFWRD